MKIRAAVVHRAKGPFVVEEVELEEPRDDELLVEIVASGVCHTDIVCRDQWIPMPLPAVLGHEGSGIVRQVGKRAGGIAVGDRVVLSWGRGCGTCRNCMHGQPAYCDDMGRVSFGGGRLSDGSTSLRLRGEPVHSHFIGQSSFATHAVVHHSHAVRVPKEAPLELLGPLGCGFLTGSGAVFDALAVRPGATVIVYGVGAVGLSAVMAANVVGCSKIIAVDRNGERLGLARELGATHTLLANDEPLAPRIASLVPGGADFAIETTANMEVLRTAFESVHLRGVCAMLGASEPGAKLELDAFSVLLGRTLKGVIVGDLAPQLAIPRLIELHARGRFPIERLVKFYDFADLDRAAADSLAGLTIKPIVRM
jgi:aryl-alcohol dehydrogenase